MKILALDTSTMMASMAVAEDGKILGEFNIRQDKGHSENLVPLVHNLLGELGLGFQDIDLYAVAKGPGSFTGLRIGVAAVKGLAMVDDTPCVAVSTLQALSHMESGSSVVVPLIDARRKRCFSGFYRSNGAIPLALLEDGARPLEEIIEICRDYDSILFTGEGSQLYHEELAAALGEKALFARPDEVYCRAGHIALIAEKMAQNGETVSHYALNADYLLLSQAEREKKEAAR